MPRHRSLRDEPVGDAESFHRDVEPSGGDIFTHLAEQAAFETSVLKGEDIPEPRRFLHNAGVERFVIYFFLGFFFSLEYKATGRIWTSMITHVGMNTLVVLVQLAVQKGLV